MMLHFRANLAEKTDSSCPCLRDFTHYHWMRFIRYAVHNEIKSKFRTTVATHNTRDNNKYSLASTRQNCTAAKCVCSRSTSAANRKEPNSFYATTIKFTLLCLIRYPCFLCEEANLDRPNEIRKLGISE
jgi:hypothetical protein